MPGPGASTIINETFISGTQPVLRFEEEWKRIPLLPWYQQRSFYLAKSGENMPEHVEDWDIVKEVWEGDEEDEDEEDEESP